MLDRMYRLSVVELRQALEAIETSLKNAHEQRDRVAQILAEKLCPFKVGDRVRRSDDRPKEILPIYLVSGIYWNEGFGIPRPSYGVKVKKIRKDGKPGEREEILNTYGDIKFEKVLS